MLSILTNYFFSIFLFLVLWFYFCHFLILQRNFYNCLGLFWVGTPQLLLKICVLSSNALEYHHISFYRFCTGTSYLIPSLCLFALSIKGNGSNFTWYHHLTQISLQKILDSMKLNCSFYHHWCSLICLTRISFY